MAYNWNNFRNFLAAYDPRTLLARRGRACAAPVVFWPTLWGGFQDHEATLTDRSSRPVFGAYWKWIVRIVLLILFRRRANRQCRDPPHNLVEGIARTLVAESVPSSAVYCSSLSVLLNHSLSQGMSTDARKSEVVAQGFACTDAFTPDLPMVVLDHA